MTPERIVGWLFAFVALLLVIWLAIVLINKIDDEPDPGLFDPSAFVAFVE